MALTRAQLLMGNIADGSILSGQPQGVRPGGAGITINTDGIIEVNSGTIVGVMKLAPTPAVAATKFNAYTWPSGAGTAGQQLETDGLGGLTWADAAGIPWTALGQLVVGTGTNTDTLLNAGTNTSFLVAQSTAPAGLAYTDSVTTAALLPAGTTAQRLTNTAGQIRFNSTNKEFEGYGSVPYTSASPTWQYFSSMPTGPVQTTAATGTVDKIFYQNALVITENYTTPTTANSMSAGPITIATGKTVTIPAGSAWTII
jgi:hypothetical protein